MVRRILVHHDTTRATGGAALAAAARLSKASGASVTLVDVAEPLSPIAAMLGPSLTDAVALARKEREDRLRLLARRIQRAAGPIETRVLEGTADEAIVATVREGGHDLVIADVDAGARDGEAVGALARRLARRCPCHVLLVRGRLHRARLRIGVAIDTPDGDASARALALALLSTGRRITALTGGVLQVLHAWDAPWAATLRNRGAASPAAIAAYEASAERRAQEQVLELIAASAIGSPDEVGLVHGLPADVLPQELAARQTDLLVVGSVARQGLSAVLIGNTAESLLDRVPCALLVVKPGPVGA